MLGRIVTIAGLPRSGSARCMNAVRLMFEMSAYPVNVSFIENFEHSDSAVNLVKIHNYSQELHSRSYRVITTIRDFRDCVASCKRLRPEKSVKEIAPEFMKRYVAWAGKSSYEMNYERYQHYPLKILFEVCDVLGLQLSETQIGNIKQELINYRYKKDWTQEDFSATMMTNEKVTNDGKIGGFKDLTSYELAWIENTYGEWLRQHGYMK